MATSVETRRSNLPDPGLVPGAATAVALLALVAALIGAPFFLLLAMQSIGDAVGRQTAVLARDVNTVLQLRARGSMGHVNMVAQDRLLPYFFFIARRIGRARMSLTRVL